MATIRSPRQVAVQSRPVTTTPPGLLDNVAGLARSLAPMGRVVKGLWDRYEDKEEQEAVGRWNKAQFAAQDEWSLAALQNPNDYTAVESAVSTSFDQLMATLESGEFEALKDQRAQIARRLDSYKRDLLRPILNRNAQANAAQAVADARAVQAEGDIPTSHIVDNLFSSEPAQKQLGYQQIVSLEETLTDENGAFVREAGQLAADTEWLLRRGQINRAVIIRTMVEAHAQGQDMTGLRMKLLSDGADVMGDDERFFGKEETMAFRVEAVRAGQELINADIEAKRQARRAREDAEKADDGAFRTQVFRELGAGVELSAIEISDRPGYNPENSSHVELLRMVTAPSFRTSGQLTAKTEMSSIIAETGAIAMTMPVSEGVSHVLGLRAQVDASGDVHRRDVPVLHGEIDDLYAKVLQRQGLTPEMSRRTRTLNVTLRQVESIREGISGPGGSAFSSGLGPKNAAAAMMGITRLEGWAARNMFDETKDPEVVMEIASLALRVPEGIEPRLLELADDPQQMAAVQADPIGMLGAFPMVRTEYFKPGQAGIDMAASIAMIQAASQAGTLTPLEVQRSTFALQWLAAHGGRMNIGQRAQQRWQAQQAQRAMASGVSPSHQGPNPTAHQSQSWWQSLKATIGGP